MPREFLRIIVNQWIYWIKVTRYLKQGISCFIKVIGAIIIARLIDYT